MAVATARPLLRWSSVRDCPRKAIFEATKAPARERTDKEQRILFRGKRIGRDYAEILSLKHNSRDEHRKFIRARNRSEESGGGYYGAGKVWCEKKIVWPLGVGHADVWLPATGTLVEVLSSAHATPQNAHSKKLQLAGYMEHDPEARNGVVVVLDPNDMSETRHIVSKHDEQYASLVEEMRARIRQVQAWDADGTLPPRVCTKPSDARGHFCVYAEVCFDGWTAPERPKVKSPDVASLARQLYEVGRLKASHGGNGADVAFVEQKMDEEGIDGALAALAKARTQKGIEWLEKHIKARLTDALGHAPEDFLHDPGEYEVGPLLLKRSVVNRAGYEVQPSSYETLTVKRVSDEPLLSGDSFGDEAPWDDDDLGPVMP